MESIKSSVSRFFKDLRFNRSRKRKYIAFLLVFLLVVVFLVLEIITRHHASRGPFFITIEGISSEYAKDIVVEIKLTENTRVLCLHGTSCGEVNYFAQKMGNYGDTLMFPKKYTSKSGDLKKIFDIKVHHPLFVIDEKQVTSFIALPGEEKHIKINIMPIGTAMERLKGKYKSNESYASAYAEELSRFSSYIVKLHQKASPILQFSKESGNKQKRYIPELIKTLDVLHNDEVYQDWRNISGRSGWKFSRSVQAIIDEHPEYLNEINKE